MSRTTWTVTVAVVTIIAAIGFYLQANKATVPTNTETVETPGEGNAAVGATGESIVIHYTDSGFSPSSVSISEGTTVTWVNESTDRMWVGSNDHPTHTKYDGSSTRDHCTEGSPSSSTVFDQCAAGSAGATYSFTFTKAGTWTYHNHARAGDQGTITVTEE